MRSHLFFVAAMLVAVPASAQDTSPGTTPGVVTGDHVLTDDASQKLPGDEKPPLGIFPVNEDKLIDPRMARSWGAAPARPFIATTLDVGFVYVRPRVSLGYGKPFSSWIGIDVNALGQTSAIGGYAGVRLEIPYVDVRFGPRYLRAFNRTYLPIKDTYTRLELETDGGTPTALITWEAELDTSIPVGPGNILGRGSISYITNIGSDQAAFEETLHVIVRPPLVWRARLGYALRLGSHDQHSIGFVVDALDVPKRSDSRTIRIGPIARMSLSRRVELRASFVVPIISPDSLRLVGGDFGELGVRYRWASE